MIWVIGNGTSRLKFDLSVLPLDQAWGCNALYRDTQVGNLVSLDYRMLHEICCAGWGKTLYTRPTNVHKMNLPNVLPTPDLPWITTSRSLKAEHFSSGSYALLLASQQGDNKIGILGFDFFSEQTPNNAYIGTTNYDINAANRIDPTYWLEQFNKILEWYPNINYYYFGENRDLVTKHIKQKNFKWLEVNDASRYI